jgi:hypothetical protein
MAVIVRSHKGRSLQILFCKRVNNLRGAQLLWLKPLAGLWELSQKLGIEDAAFDTVDHWKPLESVLF